MSQRGTRGIKRPGLASEFEEAEILKSKLILEARVLREQNQDEVAAAKFAQAAEIETRLAKQCEARGFLEKSFVHHFSAASCWAQAGDFYHAIALCEDLLARTDLPHRLRRRILDYSESLRGRRSQWYAELTAATGT